MKTHLLIVCLFFIGCHFSYGQLLKLDDSGAIVEETDETKRFHTLLKSEFSRIATSSNQGALGNYVGISTTDNNLAFTYNIVRSWHLLELSVKGGISDNISTLFESGKLNTGIELSFIDRVVFKNTASIAFSPEEIDAIVRENSLLQRKYELDTLNYLEKLATLDAALLKKKGELSRVKKKVGEMLAAQEGGVLDRAAYIRDQQQLAILEAEHHLYQSKLSEIDVLKKNEWDRLRTIRDASTNQDPQKREQFILDSLRIQQLDDSLKRQMETCEETIRRVTRNIAANEYTKEGYQTALTQLQIIEKEVETLELQKKHLTAVEGMRYKMKLYNDFDKKRAESLKKGNDIRATDVSLSWLSYGVSMSNQDFNLFDPSRSFADQVYRQNDLVPSFFVGYTFYSNRADETSTTIGARNIHYFSVAAKVKYGNNLGNLKQVDVHTTDSIAPNRNVLKVEKAYQGNYEHEIVTALFSGDYYQFIGHKDNIGFHLQATVQLGPFRPVTSIRGGLIFAALDKKDGESLINFEVFYGLNHIFKHNEENTLFNRNVAGIQATVPFNFNIK